MSALPESEAVGLPPGDALTVSVAGLAPEGATGLNRTLAVQLWPAGSVAPGQVPPVIV